MKIIKIKSKKQENGMWGTPYNCYSIDYMPLIDDRKMLIFSAAVAVINEEYNKKFRIDFSTINGFKVKIDDFGYFTINYDIYEVEGDTLYEFDNENEHLTFLRNRKLKNLDSIKI